MGASGNEVELPPDVTCTRRQLANGFAFVFRHRRLGELGQIVLVDVAEGGSKTSVEVMGDPDDPMMSRRREILEPITREILGRLADQGVGGGAPLDPASQVPVGGPGEWVKSKIVTCGRCGAGVMLLVFADDAKDTGVLEDYARKMYRNIADLDLPTWVIGPPTIASPVGQSDILKIWPSREPVRRLRPDEFHAETDHLVHGHCKL